MLGKAKVKEINKRNSNDNDLENALVEINNETPEISDMKVFLYGKTYISLYLLKTSYFLHFTEPKIVKSILNPPALKNSKSSLLQSESFRNSLNCDFRRITTVNMFK